MLTVGILSRGAGKQQYGLGQDAKLIELTLRELIATGKSKLTIIHKDPYMFMQEEPIDVYIHLELPCRAAFPLAKVNIVIPNPEWWFKAEWSWVEKESSVIMFHKTEHSSRLFNYNCNSFVVGWKCPVTENLSVAKLDQFLFIVGGSKHKHTALDAIVKFWKPDFNKLIVIASESGDTTKPNVTWITKYITNQEKQVLLSQSRYHIVASSAEGFGYTMAESVSNGAKILWTDIPVYKELWGRLLGDQGVINTEIVSEPESLMLDKPRHFSEASFLESMCNIDKQSYQKPWEYINAMNKQFRNAFFTAWRAVEKKVKKTCEFKIPPMLKEDSLPFIGVVTLVYNRPQWFIHAVRNIETSLYPRNKIVWVIVDDGESSKRVDISLEKVRSGLPDLCIKYVSLSKKTPIGEKRNIGCAAAIETNRDVAAFAFMDDDDHYPPESLNRRVSWLYGSGKGAIYCSTLPMYDTCKYISAMNVPSLNLSPCMRVSEATLCFRRSFWESRGFPKTVDIGEGEGFIVNRENDSVEISPRGVIVSFLHNKNLTSRHVPERKEPNGCHYGFSDEYFTMISQLGSA
jgi:hypothetical protein